MNKSNTNTSKAIFTFGIMGLIAGVFLVVSGNILIGVCGSIASAGISIKAYGDLKNSSS